MPVSPIERREECSAISLVSRLLSSILLFRSLFVPGRVAQARDTPSITAFARLARDENDLELVARN